MVARLLTNLGWEFDQSEPKYPGCTADPVYGSKFLKELYLKSDPGYTGRFTVPVLWDKKNECIVNNESADICQMFNASFSSLPGVDPISLVPKDMEEKIKEANEWIYDEFNNGVYKAGFATSQSACNS